MTVEGRCVAFTVTAGRHLAPREVSHPLFLATPSAAHSTGSHKGGGLSLDPGEQRQARLLSNGNSKQRSSGVCGFGDFITSKVIEGASGTGPSVHGKQQGGGGGGGAGFFARFYRGHTEDGFNAKARASWFRTDGGARHLPVLHTSTLKRRIGPGMRPMIGQQGLPDEVTWETSVARGNESVVTLRLDLSQPRQLGGYVAHTLHETSSLSSSLPFYDGRAPVLQISRLSLLLACVEGSVRAGDVLQYWTETNRPDGLVDRTAEEWVEYAQAVKEMRVPCDVLFVSLQHLLAKAQRRAAAVGGGSGGGSLALSGGRSDDTGGRANGSYEGVEEALSAADALRRQGIVPVGRSAGHASQQQQSALNSMQHQHLVPLDVVEQQLESIQQEFKRTKDGIDVTGLREDLQDALNRRKVTKSQLREIEEARRLRREQLEKNEQDAMGVLPTKANTLVGDGVYRSNQQQQQPVYQSQKERLLEALKLYKRVAAAGGDNREVVAAIRIRLPHFDPFVVPYSLFIRTALHKDVICGTNISAAADLTSPLVAVPAPNVYSTVPMGRVEIVDQPARVAPYPLTIKQCEVEGNMPVLSLNVTGARYAAESFAASSVFLEEIPNPELPERYRTPTRTLTDTNNAVGLLPCLANLTDGMKVTVARMTKKHLHLYLSACPAFRMLAAEEYNEQQDTEELLQRLKYPRLLKVTVRNALKPDSFTAKSGEGTPVSGPLFGSGDSSESGSSLEGGHASKTGMVPAFPNTQHHQQQQRAHSQAALREVRTSLDVTFVVRVAPTLAFLHLRNGARKVLETGSGRGAFAGQQQQQQQTFGPGVDSGRFVHNGFKANAARPLVVCEHDMRKDGFELGVELLGDHWTTPVGEIRADGSVDYSDDSDSDHGSADTHRGYYQQDRLSHHRQHGPRDRSAANVALLNSFSIVEHYTLESAHHLFLKGAGVYRSHFIHYLFSSVLGDANILQNHRFVRRYNSTFVSIAVPPQPLSSLRRGGDGNHNNNYWWRGSAQQQLSSLWLEELDIDAIDGLMGVSANEDMYIHNPDGAATPVKTYPPISQDNARQQQQQQKPFASFQLPAVRRFSKVEEILFAVPGIATACQGCLLADTTFFVAGDLTGLWSFPGYYNGASSSASFSAGPATASSATTLRRRGALAAGGPQLPTALPPLDNSVLTRPLVLPWHEAGVVPRAWQLHWLCPTAAHTALNAFYHLWESVQASYRDDFKYRRHMSNNNGLSNVLGDATLHMEVVMYTAKDTAGATLPLSQRPVSLLKSDGIPLTRVLPAGSAAYSGSSAASSASYSRIGGSHGQSLVFKVRESAAEAAFTSLAADYLRFRRPGSRAAGLAPAFRYHKEERFAGGLTAVNASVFVKLCVPLPSREPREGDAPAQPAATTTSCMVVSVTDSLITVEAPKAPRSPSYILRLLRPLLGRKSPAKDHHQDSWATARGEGSSLYTYLTGKHTGSAHGFPLAALLHHVFLASMFFLVLPLLSVEAARRSESQRRRRQEGRGTDGRGRGHFYDTDDGELRDVDASRVRSFFTLSGLLAGSGFVEEGTEGDSGSGDLAREAAAYEARVAFTIMFFVLILFAYAFLPMVWLVVALALWTYILYKAKDGLILLLFVGYMVYWRFLM